MSYKCRICGSNEVDNQGDICELCAIGQDPYAANMAQPTGAPVQTKKHLVYNTEEKTEEAYAPKRGGNRKVLVRGGAELSNTDPYGNDMTVNNTQPQVQVYSAGQVPQQTVSNTAPPTAVRAQKAATNVPLTAGITKNITVDEQKDPFIVKWFRSLFMGVPFAFDDEVTMFQVFPDYTGTSTTASGYACDQVIVYGKLNHGAVSDNNEVEVYGHRDSSNNIVAKVIKNKASGTTVSPNRSMSPAAVWVITLLVLFLVGGAVLGLGPVGIVWAIVLVLCLTNLPLVFKIIGAIFGALFSLIKKFF